MVNEAWEDHHFFINLRYPSALEGYKPIYDSLAYRDYLHETYFLEYLKTKDHDHLADQVLELFNDQEQNHVTEILDTLMAPSLSETRQLVFYYMLMHNTYLNYYGSLIDYDLAAIKEQYLIESLPIDWFFSWPLWKNRTHGLRDLRNNIYSLP